MNTSLSSQDIASDLKIQPVIGPHGLPSSSVFFSEHVDKVLGSALQVEEDLQAGRLLPMEDFWRDNQPWLKTKGYLLRKRYQPGWVASWLGIGGEARDFEDGIPFPNPRILDARRTSDQKNVVLKRISKSNFPHEVRLLQAFNLEGNRGHPQNHCVPVYEVLSVPDEPDYTVVAMPLLHPNDSPPFDTIGEVVEFFNQMFRGLWYFHVNKIAHCDVKIDNILMNGEHLWKRQPHPWKNDYTWDLSGSPVAGWTRTESPVKYYFIDLGLSRYFPQNRKPLLPSGYGGDKTVPEFKTSSAVDPFSGSDGIHRPSAGLKFLNDLIADMTQDDPTKRPTIAEALTRLDAIRLGLSQWTLRSQLLLQGEKRSWSRALHHWWKTLGYIVRGKAALPEPPEDRFL